MPLGNPTGAIALTHGAGSNCNAPLIFAVADALQQKGFCVLRYDLPFRHGRVSGPPPGNKAGQARDREGIRIAASFLTEEVPAVPLCLAGHSYGGRQSSMVLAEDAETTSVDALLLLSYPLHPPGQPEKLRIEHFPALRTPTLFVHGTKDEFATPDELGSARKLIPARTEIKIIDRAGHGLPVASATNIANWFQQFATPQS